MEQVSLRADTGRARGSRASRRLRAGGLVPAVVYGRGFEATPVAVDSVALRQALHTESGLNVLINLEVEGDEHLTVARELQRDPIRGDVLHLDFVKVSLTETIEADVALHFLGEPIGVREDMGVGETVRGSVVIEALPTDVPPHIEIDVSHMRLGDSLNVEDLPVLPGVTYVDPPEATIYTVIIPRVAVEEEVEEPELEAALLLEGEEGEEVEGEAAEEAAEEPAPED